MWQVVSDTMSPQVSAIARGRPDDSRQWQTASAYPACDAEASQPLGLRDHAAVEVIGERWSLLVLRDVMFGRRRHFRVLQERPAEGRGKSSRRS